MESPAYAQMIEVKRWADRGLYAALDRQFGRLNELEASIVLRILDHIHVVDRIFRHHLQGTPHNLTAPRSDSVPDLATLARTSAEMDDWYAAYAAGLSPGDLAEMLEFAFTSGKQARMTRGEILMHVCLHGTYHRGNAGAVLQLKGLTPASDAVTDYLEQEAGR